MNIATTLCFPQKLSELQRETWHPIMGFPNLSSHDSDNSQTDLLALHLIAAQYILLLFPPHVARICECVILSQL